MKNSGNKKNKGPDRPTGLQGWLDKQDVLVHLNISSRTLQKWRTEKLIAHSRIGGKIFYHLDDLLEILEKNKVQKR